MMGKGILAGNRSKLINDLPYQMVINSDQLIEERGNRRREKQSEE